MAKCKVLVIEDEPDIVEFIQYNLERDLLDHAAALDELFALLRHALLGIFAHLFGDLHRAEAGAAHGAEVGGLGRLGRQGFIVVVPGSLGIQGEIELVLPAKFKAGAGEGVVSVLGAGMSLGHVRRMGSNLVGDESLLHLSDIHNQIHL